LVTGALLLVSLLITACASPAEPPTEELSRRTSTCGYLVAFPLDDARLTVSARSVIDQAALEAGRNGDNSISLIGTWDSREAEALMRQRMDVIANEISLVGAFSGTITRTEPGPDTVPGGSYIGISVCNLRDDVRGHPPPPTDRRVIVVLGGVALAIPLRDLGPLYWRDIPFEPRHLGALDLDMAWTPMTDRLAGVVNDCAQASTDGCGYQVHIHVNGPPYQRDGATDFQRIRPSDLHRIPGERYGIKFFTRKGLGKGRAVIEGTTKQGETIIGACAWKPEESEGEGPSITQIVQGISHHAATGAGCVLNDFPVGNGLHATFFTDDGLSPHWDEIHSFILRLFDDYREAALENPTKH
jgi:hypothetical protein